MMAGVAEAFQLPPTVYTVTMEGQEVTTPSTPANTNLTTVYTVGNGKLKFKNVHIATNAAANVTVVINDGSTDHYYLRAEPMEANRAEDWYPDLILKEGWIIKVQTSSANNATFFINGALLPKTLG